jgi:hypothetical protein
MVSGTFDCNLIGTRTMPPQGTNLVLSSDIPHSERNVLVLDGLDVESCSNHENATKPALES